MVKIQERYLIYLLMVIWEARLDYYVLVKLFMSSTADILLLSIKKYIVKVKKVQPFPI